MSIETVYRTTDGSIFGTKEDAEKHEYLVTIYDCITQKFGDSYSNEIRIEGVSELYECVKFLQDSGVKV